MNCSMTERADNHDGFPSSNHGVLTGRNPAVVLVVAVPQLRCTPETSLGVLSRLTICRNRRIHPSTYGGVGGRGRETPPTRLKPRFGILLEHRAPSPKRKAKCAVR